MLTGGYLQIDKILASAQPVDISLAMTDPILVSPAFYLAPEAISGLLYGSI
jgi:hypothetical protein